MFMSLLELASNDILDYDADAADKLKSLHGKSIRLNVKPFSPSILIRCINQQLEFEPNSDEVGDAGVIVSLAALLEISRKGLEQSNLASGQIEFHGDPIIGQKFMQLFAQLDIQWQHLIATHFGEHTANVSALAATHVNEIAQQSVERSRSMLQHWLQRELELSANKEEVDQFSDEVDRLRSRVDRLRRRIESLAEGATT